MFEIHSFDIEEDYILLDEVSIQGEDSDIIIKRNNFDNIKTITTNINFIPSSGHFKVFNLESYLEEIWSSYKKSLLKLQKQFDVDFPRQTITINDIICSDKKEFTRFISTLSTNFDITNLFMLLTTQAAYMYQFETLYNIYTKFSTNNSIHLIHSSNKSKARPKINIYTKISLQVEIEIYFDVYNIDKDIKLKEIITKLFIDLNQKQAILAWRET